MDFQSNSPFNPGLSPNLVPNPPTDIPEAPGAGDALKGLSPFTQEQDVDQIIKQLVLDRPLKLYIPNREKYPEWEFRIINNLPGEIAAANNKGFRQIDDPELAGLFTDLIAGKDKDGKAYRPLLFARPKKVGEAVRKRNREQLRSLYAGMDPANKAGDIAGKYTTLTDRRDGTFLDRTGQPWKIRV